MKFATLMYHQITNASLEGKYWVSLDSFKRQVDYLVGNRFKTIDFNEDDYESNARYVLITFDDGHASNFEAAEELYKRGLKGVFYILKDKSLNDPAYLTEDQLRQMAKMGHVLGVHGKDHRWWTKKDDAQLVAEFSEVINWLEYLCEKKVITCSAPGGILNSRIEGLIREKFIDLKYIRNSVPFFNDELAIERTINSVGMMGKMSMAEFKKIVNIDHFYYSRMMACYHAKNIIKKILGRV